MSYITQKPPVYKSYITQKLRKKNYAENFLGTKEQ